MEKIKIGFAGLGDHALQFHLKPLLKIECVEFAGALSQTFKLLNVSKRITTSA